MDEKKLWALVSLKEGHYVKISKRFTIKIIICIIQISTSQQCLEITTKTRSFVSKD